MSTRVSPTTFLVKLKNRFSVAERTMAFQFEKPSGFIFKPGQWIDITLLSPSQTDAKGSVRGFSIASAPYTKTRSWWQLECAIRPSSVNWQKYP